MKTLPVPQDRPLAIDQTPEFHVEVRLKNNRLYQLRVEAGLNQNQVARAVGMSPTSYGRYENMVESPYGKNAEWKPTVLALSEFWRELPEDLFPDAVAAVERNRASREMSFEQVQAFLAEQADPALIEAPRTPDDEYDAIALRDKIEMLLDDLTPQEERVLRLRYGLDDGRDQTFREIGSTLDLSVERVRQIENNALRKLRWPGRAKHLRPFVPGGHPGRMGCAAPAQVATAIGMDADRVEAVATHSPTLWLEAAKCYACEPRRARDLVVRGERRLEARLTRIRCESLTTAVEKVKNLRARGYLCDHCYQPTDIVWRVVHDADSPHGLSHVEGRCPVCRTHKPIAYWMV